jgi:2-polyprenyl-3-methyl-5-hydroxy-6-metoxy-1,4-benzoquinol methylase
VNYDEKAVAKYRERRKKYISYGLDQYKNAEYIVSLTEPLNGSILEVGTGRGLLTSYLARKAAVTTIDIDNEVQLFAKELAKSEGVFDKVTFIIRDILKEPYAHCSFDIIISANAVHHFEEPEKMITAICRTASRKIVIADFNREGFEILDKIHREEGDSHSHGRFSIDEAGELMKTAGLKINRHERLQTVVYCGEK